MRILVHQLIGNVIICFGCSKIPYLSYLPIRIKIIDGGLNIYIDFTTFMPIFSEGQNIGIKGQHVVKAIYIQAPMKYFLNHNPDGQDNIRETIKQAQNKHELLKSRK